MRQTHTGLGRHNIVALKAAVDAERELHLAFLKGECCGVGVVVYLVKLNRVWDGPTIRCGIANGVDVVEMILSLASRHNHNVVAFHLFPVGYACSLYLNAGSCERNVVHILLARLKLNVGRDGCLVHHTVVLELDVACCGIVAIDVRQHDSLNIAVARTVCRAHLHIFLGVARHHAKLVGNGIVRHLGVHTLDISLEVGQR